MPGQSPIQENSLPSNLHDRWSMVATAVAIGAVIQFLLVWNVPDSVWIWAVAIGLVACAATTGQHPSLRYWRRASWLFAPAGILAAVPALTIRLELVVADQAILIVGLR